MKFIQFDYINQEKIWGNEEWIISAHENGMAKIKGNNQGLQQFYQENREMFGRDLPAEFPLLVKIITSNDDLSIQVHPGDEYAKVNENSLGKTECWYILETNDSDIIAGQNPTSRKEVKSKIENNEILDLLNVQSIKKGDFFYIPAGCVHAIRKNTKLLEIQQSSDITYRLYDYDRRDKEGNLRELHIDKSLDVIDYDYQNNYQPIIKEQDGIKHTELCTSKYFYVDLFEDTAEITVNATDEFKMLIALDGYMEVDGQQIDSENAIILLKGQSVVVKPTGKLIISGINR